jgi:hypothetical protein
MPDISQEFLPPDIHDVIDPLADAVLANPGNTDIMRMFLKAGSQFCKPEPIVAIRE